LAIGSPIQIIILEMLTILKLNSLSDIKELLRTCKRRIEMEPEPVGFDAIIQQALDALREYASQQPDFDETEAVVALHPSQVLCANGFSNTDALRTYSAMKNLGLVEVIKRGRANIAPVICLNMNTSVMQRRIERAASHRRSRKLLGNAALLDYYNRQEAELRSQLDKVMTTRAKLIAQIESEQSSNLQPT
jgi:hypothetical protein